MQRFQDTLTGPAERALLNALCVRMPRWVTSDGLTLFGIFGAALTFGAYWLAGYHTGFLWLAVLGLFINWFGDSLDGSLARHRKLERPQYGFFLDHNADVIAMALIAIGIGLSPKAHLIFAVAVLVAYYQVVILSMITCLSTGVFRVSFGGIGPTEIRLVVAICTLTAIFLPTPWFLIGGLSVSIYDLALSLVTALLVVGTIVQMVRTARALAAIDPPRR